MGDRPRGLQGAKNRPSRHPTRPLRFSVVYNLTKIGKATHRAEPGFGPCGSTAFGPCRPRRSAPSRSRPGMAEPRSSLRCNWWRLLPPIAGRRPSTGPITGRSRTDRLRVAGEEVAWPAGGIVRVSDRRLADLGRRLAMTATARRRLPAPATDSGAAGLAVLGRRGARTVQAAEPSAPMGATGGQAQGAKRQQQQKHSFHVRYPLLGRRVRNLGCPAGDCPGSSAGAAFFWVDAATGRNVR